MKTQKPLVDQWRTREILEYFQAIAGVKNLEGLRSALLADYRVNPDAISFRQLTRLRNAKPSWLKQFLAEFKLENEFRIWEEKEIAPCKWLIAKREMDYQI